MSPKEQKRLFDLAKKNACMELSALITYADRKVKETMLMYEDSPGKLTLVREEAAKALFLRKALATVRKIKP